MITLNPNSENNFLIYKTNITGLTESHLVEIVNELTGKTKALDFAVSEALRAYEVTLSVTNLAAFAGQNTLFIKEGSAIIYTEIVRINDL